MNNSQEIAQTIKEVLKKKRISASKMLAECNMNKNSLYTMQTEGYLPRVEALAKIADYLDCSVDYLLGRTDVPEVNKKTAYVHHMDEQYSVPYIAAYGEGDVTPKGKFSDEDIEEIERRGRNH